MIGGPGKYSLKYFDPYRKPDGRKKAESVRQRGRVTE